MKCTCHSADKNGRPQPLAGPRPMAINLTDIAVEGVRLGIYPQERHDVQPIVVHLRLLVDVSAVAHGDDIAHTADYAAIIRGAQGVCLSQHFDLLESLVMAVARQQLLAHDKVLWADVEILKLKAPVAARVSARWQMCRCAL